MMTVCRRGELVGASSDGPGLTPAFLRDLKQFDRYLEPKWFPHKNRWALYRVARQGTTPSGDYLVKEMELRGPQGQYRPPGPWVIDALRFGDKTRGGTVDPQTGSRAWLKKLDDEERARKEADQKRVREVSEYTTKQVEKFALTERYSA
jgi:hypothetical protein